MKNQRSKKMNNKGFTLIELLIAIAILAVIVTPILKSMITSMKVNHKADDMLNETAVAQTVMEGIQNMTLEEIATQFSTTTNAGGQLSFLPSGMGGTVHTEFQNSFTLENGSYVFNKSTVSNVYTFGVADLEYDNKKYDVKVILDASDYYKKASETTEKYNDKLYVDLADYDSDYDGLYVQSSNINSELCSKLAVKCVTANNHKTADDIAEEADRTITLNIDSTPVVGSFDELIEVSMNYKLEVPQEYVGTGVKNWEDQNFNALYKNTEDTSRKVRNVYVLYNPNYSSVNNHMRDHIVINNPNNIPVTVYLIKQSCVETFEQSASETKYRVDVKVVEGAKGTEYATKLRTNIGYNLYDLLKDNTYREETLQAHLEYECAGASYPEDIYTATEKITGGSNDTVRIFNKKVEVYPSGSYANNFSGAPLTTLDTESVRASVVTPVPTSP